MRDWRRNRNPNENDSSDDESSTDHSVNEDDNEDVRVSESEILYSIDSFYAVVTPVTICMVASALVVVFVNTDETRKLGEEIFARSYQILTVESDNNDDSSQSQTSFQNLGNSLFNTLVIVSVICVLTFVVVLCYKYKCKWIFLAYMVLVTLALLGYFTFQIARVAIHKYRWVFPNIDKLTLVFLLYNYAVVGTLSIFLPRGFPRWVPQGYLIAGSVCMAWQLAFFNAWMTWSLLVMLALYDLFAVLTPCGPLKFLAELIQQDGALALPGMLYEADLPSDVTRPRRNDSRRSRSRGRPPEPSTRPATQGIPPRSSQTAQTTTRRRTATRTTTTTTTTASLPLSDSDSVPRENSNFSTQQPSRLPRRSSRSRSRRQIARIEQDGDISTSLNGGEWPSEQQREGEEHFPQGNDSLNAREAAISLSQSGLIPPVDMSNKGKAPLVLARMYQLPVLDKRGVLRPRERSSNNEGAITETNESESNDNHNGSGAQPNYYSVEEIQEMEFTPEQLKTVVTCIFPPRGGRITKAKSREQKYDAGTAYIVYDRSGNQQRKFVVTPTGSVKEVLRRQTSGEGNESDDDNSKKETIKLGIGDFIFYSLLVSRAGLDSFTAFASCLLVVLAGLAATLVILAIQGKALPALPISIFLGVIAFLWTTMFLEPWVGSFLVQSMYV